jgi:hypothetical protein
LGRSEILVASELDALPSDSNMLRRVYTELYSTRDLEDLDLNLLPHKESFALPAPND